MATSAVPNSVPKIVDHLVLDIQKMIKDKESPNYHAAVCVYRVPKSLSSAKPDAFAPQFVGLGPYHHCRPELYTKEKLKVAAAEGVLKDLFPHTDLGTLLEIIKKDSSLDTLIGDCYHRGTGFYHGKLESLLCLMTVDALSLYDLLRSLEKKIEGSDGNGEKFVLNDSILTGKQGTPLVNAAGVELTKEAIIRDVFMLENQIPTVVLKKIMTVITNTETEPHLNVDEDLSLKMLNFCRAFCPLLEIEQLSNESEAVKHVHLLDLMYHLIVREPDPESKPEAKREPEPEPEPEPKPEDKQAKQGAEDDHKSSSKKDVKLNRCCYAFCFILVLLFFFCYAVVYIVKLILDLLFWVLRSLFGLLVKLLRFCSPAVDMLHDVLSNSDLPFLDPIKKLVRQVKGTGKLFQSTNSDMGARPAVTIPSVTELHQGGIRFLPAEGGISKIDFDDVDCKFYLPVIKLDVNSEVIIRNLMAYESLTKSSCLTFTRYIEVMRAIIDTAEDVKLLVDVKIIQTELSDEVVAQLFNGMSKSIRPTKALKLEKVIKKVNTKFDSTQKLHRFMINYVYPFGKFFVLLGALAFLALQVMQTYCSFYNCSGTSKVGKLPEDGDYGRNNYFISSM